MPSPFSDHVDSLSRLVDRLVRWLALVMVLIGSWNALARWLDREFGSGLSSNSWLEAQWYLFALLFLFGAAGTLRQDRHVRVDVFYSRLSSKGKAWVDLLGTLLLLVPFSIVIIVISWEIFLESIAIGETSPDPGGLIRYPLRLAIPAGFALLTLQGIAIALRSIRLLRDRGSS